jgi:hypothetical protein
MTGLEIGLGVLFVVLCVVGISGSASDEGAPQPPDTRPVGWTINYTDDNGTARSDAYRVDWVKIAIIAGAILAGGVALMGGR